MINRLLLGIVEDSICVEVKQKEVQTQAYCMKCRKKVEIKNPRAITMKNKRPATQGICPRCGTEVFRIGKA